MSAKIYYFSGTGNSLAVSRKLKELLVEQCSITPLSIFANEERIEVDTNVLGLVFPVYFETIPDIVKSFVKKLHFTTNTYIFAIATCNAVPGHSLFTLFRALRTKGRELSLGFVIDMPGNALVTAPEIVIERLKNSHSKISEMADCINKRSTHKIEGDNSLKCHMKSLFMGILGKRFFVASNLFSTISECNGCGICERVCPIKNIKMVNKKPSWGKNCARCVACYHWCPRKAVVIGKIFTKRDQYHNPEVSIKDMV
jgi:Pyruvate/2-oxoacid:ferredoxin oxidoreductase delta subunit